MPFEPLPERQALVAILLAVAMLVVVIELVRKRKLREEYSFLWVGTALSLILLALSNDVLIWFTQLIGAAVPTSGLFFGGLVFLMLVALQFSIRISKMALRQKAMAQRTALLEQEVDELKRELRARDASAREERPDARKVASGER